MTRLLFLLATGPENPTKAALAFLVARTAAADGHEVTFFLAGDAVHLLRDETMDVTMGVGTGSIREHYTGLAAAGARFFASGLSSKARAIDGEAIGDKPVVFVPPNRLVELIVEAERVVTF